MSYKRRKKNIQTSDTKLTVNDAKPTNIDKITDLIHFNLVENTHDAYDFDKNI